MASFKINEENEPSRSSFPFLKEMPLEVESVDFPRCASSKISSSYFGGRSTSAGIGSTPLGSGYVDNRVSLRSKDQDRNVPSILLS